MTTRQQIVDAAMAKKPSDPAADPPRVSLVVNKREDLIAALQNPANPKAVELLAGVTAAGAGSDCINVREDVLTALGMEAASEQSESEGSAEVS